MNAKDTNVLVSNCFGYLAKGEFRDGVPSLIDAIKTQVSPIGTL